MKRLAALGAILTLPACAASDPSVTAVNLVGILDACPTRSTDVLSLNIHDFSGRVCVAQEDAP